MLDYTAQTDREKNATEDQWESEPNRAREGRPKGIKKRFVGRAMKKCKTFKEREKNAGEQGQKRG